MKKTIKQMLGSFAVLLLGVMLVSGVKTFAETAPALNVSPKAPSIEYAKDEWEPSGLNVLIPNEKSVYKFYDDESGFYPAIQVDWKFSKDDEWKYTSLWDSAKKSDYNNGWEYVDESTGDPAYDKYTSIRLFGFDKNDSGWTEYGWNKVVPSSYFKTVDRYDQKLTMIDWNKVEVQIRYRYIIYKEVYNDALEDYETLSSATKWSDTVSFGNFSKDYSSIDNILVNPDFEDGLKGWKDPDKVWEFVFSSDVGDPKHGICLTWPARSSELEKNTTRIYQDVSLEKYKADDTVIFNAMICNYDQAPHDMGKVTLGFLDEKGKTIATYSQAQRNPNWNSQSLICSIPEGAKTVRVSLWAYRYVGSDIDAYYDYCSLVVKPIKVYPVTVTEKNNKSKAKKGDKLQLVANNTKTKDPSDYVWSSSYNTAATVDKNGLVTLHTDAEDGFAVYAKDKESGVTGVFWINSTEETNASSVVDESVISKTEKPATPSISKLKAAKKAVTVSWKKGKGITGYEIRYSLNADMSKAKTVQITKSSTVKKKISKLTSKKTYYVQIRTYVKDGKNAVYSDWSKAKSVKIK